MVVDACWFVQCETVRVYGAPDGLVASDRRDASYASVLTYE